MLKQLLFWWLDTTKVTKQLCYKHRKLKEIENYKNLYEKQSKKNNEFKNNPHANERNCFLLKIITQ